MGYSASDAIERVKLKGWVSNSTSLTDPQILELLNDSLRSYVVPFTKALRDEWWVGKTDIVLTTDSNGCVTLPNSVASTLRTVAWNNAGILQPLSRIEPESAYAFQPGGGAIPCGFELRGYTLRVLPVNPNLQLHITAMLRPAEMVLEEDAALVESFGGPSHDIFTLASVPLAWQSETPEAVDIIAGDSPFSTLGSVRVISLVGNVLTVDLSTSSAQSASSYWVADVGASPFPNLPIELHPLLEQHVIVTLYTGLGDKRLKGAGEMLQALAMDLRKTMSPRTQGQSRPLLNPVSPGMRTGRWWAYGR